jgi:hypothetical protein
MLQCLPNNRELKHKQCKMIVLKYSDAILISSSGKKRNLSCSLMGPKSAAPFVLVIARLYRITDERAATERGPGMREKG